MLRAIRAVASGDAIVGAEGFPQLTEREREILGFLAHNRSNEEIADRLGLSVKTVRNHIANICTKLAVAHRTQAVMRARDAGLGRR